MGASSGSGPSSLRGSPVQQVQNKTRVAAPSPVVSSTSPVAQYTVAQYAAPVQPPLPPTPHPSDPNPEVHMERVRQQMMG